MNARPRGLSAASRAGAGAQWDATRIKCLVDPPLHLSASVSNPSVPDAVQIVVNVR